MEMLFNGNTGLIEPKISSSKLPTNHKGEILFPLVTKSNIIINQLKLFLNSGNQNSYDGTGINWNDLTENNLNATLVNSPSYTQNNKGLILFNGLDQSATIDDLFELDYSNSFTIQTVVNLASGFQTYPHIFSLKGNSSRLNLFYSESGPYRGLNFGDVNSMKMRTDELISKDSFNLITFSFLGGNYKDSSNYIIEVNNEIKNNYNTSNILASGSKNRLGNQGAPRSSYWWKGSIPVLLVYEKLLSTQEKNNNYNVLNKVYNF